jgi:hypothetical protein
MYLSLPRFVYQLASKLSLCLRCRLNSGTRRGVRMPSSTRGIDLPAATSNEFAHTLVFRVVAWSVCGVVSIGTRAITVQCPSLSPNVSYCVFVSFTNWTNGVANSFRRVVVRSVCLAQCILCVRSFACVQTPHKESLGWFTM